MERVDRRPRRDLRRTDFLRPEFLLSTTEVARRLGVCVATVHKAINTGKLRSQLFGAVRLVTPEDLDAYIQTRADDRPKAQDGWRTVRDLMRAGGLSRSQAYRLLARGGVPFKVFAGVRYIRAEDIAAFGRNATQRRRYRRQ